MIKIFMSCALLLATSTAFALPTEDASNPQMRACRTVKGQFMVINSDFDQIGLCQIGQTIVGAIDILNKDAPIEIPLSLYNYRKGIMSCNRANLTMLTTPQGNQIYVCLYGDGSLIDIDTLKAGKASLRNVDLNRALNVRF